MAETTKVMYIVVVDDDDVDGNWKEWFRYTRPVLQSTLQLMGCKARHAFKVISDSSFFSSDFFFFLIYFPITSLSSSSDSLFLSFNCMRLFPFNFSFLVIKLYGWNNIITNTHFLSKT